MPHQGPFGRRFIREMEGNGTGRMLPAKVNSCSSCESRVGSVKTLYDQLRLPSPIT